MHEEVITRHFGFGLVFNLFYYCLKPLIQEQGVMTMNVISSVAAVAGILLTCISFQYQHGYCQVPSIEGICVIGRVLYNVSSLVLASS